MRSISITVSVASRFAVPLALAATCFACTAHDEPAPDPQVPVVLPAALGSSSTTSGFAPSQPQVPHHAYGIPSGPAPRLAPAQVYTPPRGIAYALPPSIDLSSEAPPPGNQGNTGSCQSWATGYSAMGWWANHVGIANAKFAPMYVYAQMVNGNCSNGAWAEAALQIMQQQGIETSSDYEPMQQVLDCATQPSTIARANAGNFKISGYTQYDLSGGAQAAVIAALAAGKPAIISIQVYPEFDNASSTNYFVGPPQPGDPVYGGHAIAAFAYDQNGVWILNSWSTGWGSNGWAELSWDFINGSYNGTANLNDVVTIDGLPTSCTDSNQYCQYWAQTSQCQENPDYMLSNCCASCANPDLAYRSYTFEPAYNTASCLDVTQDSSTDETPIEEYTCNGTPAQTFTVLDGGYGWIQLYHVDSGKCVDAYRDAATNGTQIQLYHCHGGNAQSFYAQANNDGSVTFVNANGLCVDIDQRGTADGTKVQLWGCNGTVAQRWTPVAQ